MAFMGFSLLGILGDFRGFIVEVSMWCCLVWLLYEGLCSCGISCSSLASLCSVSVSTANTRFSPC